MKLKHIKNFRIFEQIDAFDRVGDKLWVLLRSSLPNNLPYIAGPVVSDERSYYFKRYEPEEVTDVEKSKLEELFSEFNGYDTSFEPEKPTDNGYFTNIGAFTVRLKCGSKNIPFSFYKRWDDWWMIWCRSEYQSVNWCLDTKLCGSSVVLCDTIRGVVEFINDYIPDINESDVFDIDKFINRKESYPEEVGSVLYSSISEKSEWWNYLGTTNGAQWSRGVNDLLENQIYRQMSEDELITITKCLEPVLRIRPLSFINTNKYVDTYPSLKSVQNSKFENCWFMVEGVDHWGFTYGWDMCVQGFSDEWYLVSVGDGRGYVDYWYRVDTLEGLHNFINRMFIEPYNESYLEIKFNDKLTLIDKEGVEIKNPLFSGLTESLGSDSLVRIIGHDELSQFEDSHTMLPVTDDDIEVFNKFIFDLYSGDSINLERAKINMEGAYYVPIDGIVDSDETYQDGEFMFYKYDDEWYIVLKYVSGWNNNTDSFLIDTLQGFKELKNYVND